MGGSGKPQSARPATSGAGACGGGSWGGGAGGPDRAGGWGARAGWHGGRQKGGSLLPLVLAAFPLQPQAFGAVERKKPTLSFLLPGPPGPVTRTFRWKSSNPGLLLTHGLLCDPRTVTAPLWTSVVSRKWAVGKMSSFTWLCRGVPSQATIFFLLPFWGTGEIGVASAPSPEALEPPSCRCELWGQLPFSCPSSRLSPCP